MTKFKNCKICNSSDITKAYSLKRFDLLLCSECRHLFSELKVQPQVYDDSYFITGNQEHFNNPDTQLFNYIHHLIQQYTRLKSSLDIGTGVGLLPRYFRGLGYDSSGIDISIEAISHGTEVLQIPQLSAVDIVDYQPDKFFPIITNINVVEHVEEPLEFLSHIHRVLDEDGIFICTTVDSNSLIFSLAKFFFKYSFGNIEGPLDRVCDIHHLHHFNQQSFHRALREVGFDIVETFSTELPLHTLTLSPLQKLSVGGMYLFSQLLDSHFVQGVVCRKR